jgi:hypothetical protein
MFIYYRGELSRFPLPHIIVVVDISEKQQYENYAVIGLDLNNNNIKAVYRGLLHESGSSILCPATCMCYSACCPARKLKVRRVLTDIGDRRPHSSENLAPALTQEEPWTTCRTGLLAYWLTSTGLVFECVADVEMKTRIAAVANQEIGFYDGQ